MLGGLAHASLGGELTHASPGGGSAHAALGGELAHALLGGGLAHAFAATSEASWEVNQSACEVFWDIALSSSA